MTTSQGVVLPLAAEAVHAEDEDAWTVVPYAEDHDWHERFNLTCCRKCGFIRRADGQNKPCKGVVRVELREAEPVPAARNTAEI